MDRAGIGRGVPCRTATWCAAVLLIPLGIPAALAQSPDPGDREQAAASANSPWTGGDSTPGDDDDEGQLGERREGKEGQTGGPGKGVQPLPTPLGWLVEPLNPARLQYALDEWLGLNVGKWSDKPRAPEVPLAIFRETIRPLGALKYENQPSYLITSFTGQAPSEQAFSYDYVFADWHAVRFEYTWANGDPEKIVLGYQRTLGVGPRHNWVHAISLVPEFVLAEHFLAGTALYTLAWKPTEESPWTVAPAVGINRVDRHVASAAAAGEALGATGLLGERRTPEGERTVAAWRPLLTLNVFYTLSPSWTVGIENDFLPHDKLPEYLVLPMFNYRPTQHFFIQLGAGWYQLGSDSQFTFMCRANLLFPSPRKSR